MWQVRKFSQSWQVRVSTAFKRLLIILATPWDISLYVIYIIYMICMHVYVYMHVCICVCIYMYTYICVLCVYMRTYVAWCHGTIEIAVQLKGMAY